MLPLLFVSKMGPDGSIPMIAENANCVLISCGKQFIYKFIPYEVDILK